MTPRVLFASPTRYVLPLPGWLRHKWGALERVLDYRVLARGSGFDERFTLLRGGRFSYVRFPVSLRWEIMTFRPHVILTEDPRMASLALLARKLSAGTRPAVVAEVHGDWRLATRLYGSGFRRALSPTVDAVARYGIRHADAVRAVSGYTARLVVDERGAPPEAVFPAYTALSAFAADPARSLPDRPTAVFVGALERSKNIDGLAEARRQVVRRLPEAKLVVVGTGSRVATVRRLVAELPDSVEYVSEVPPEGVARALDDATVLVLPSRDEGLGRVVIEAFARGRGVVASRAGGILDLVEHEREGLLVDLDDADGLVAALVRVLSDRSLAERLGTAAQARFPKWNQSADQWAERMRELVDAVLRQADGRVSPSSLRPGRR